MRINGRLLRPSTLAERRVLHALGANPLRVSRRFNPYVVARRIARIARLDSTDGEFLRSVVRGARSTPLVPTPTAPSPDLDTNDPVPIDAAAE